MKGVDVTVRVVLPDEATTDDLDSIPAFIDRGFSADLAEAKRRMIFHGRIVKVDREPELGGVDERFNRGEV